jgi:hypothetical protein
MLSPDLNYCHYYFLLYLIICFLILIEIYNIIIYILGIFSNKTNNNKIYALKN